ncbi:MAG: 4-hydroxybenzoate synthetase [Thiotrichales bacterium]|nr:MAG: 4-hydroxybenzoate synthetase [Thiotrichales bacterium]
MSTVNFFSSNKKNHPDQHFLNGLSRFQRILMVTDGTVTELLEQYAEETIKVCKLSEKIDIEFDELLPNHRHHITKSDLPVLTRTILLQGQTTKKNWLYAQSSIFLDNLQAGFRSDLLASREPIGRLWEKYRCETFKRILDFEKRPAGESGEYFNLPADSTLLSRTYSVYSGGKLIMIITEMFPDELFTD